MRSAGLGGDVEKRARYRDTENETLMLVLDVNDD